MTFEDALARWLPTQRWYSGIQAPIHDLSITADTTLLAGDPGLRHLIVTAAQGGESSKYQVLAGFRSRLPARLSHAVIGPAADGMTAYDALHDPELAGVLLRAIAGQRSAGQLRFGRESGAVIDDWPDARVLRTEQSNTSVVFGESAILKVLRRPFPGRNPDLEVTAALWRLGSSRVAAPLGWIETSFDGEPALLGVLSQYLPHATDGWTLAVSGLRDLYGRYEQGGPGEYGGHGEPGGHGGPGGNGEPGGNGGPGGNGEPGGNGGPAEHRGNGWPAEHSGNGWPAEHSGNGWPAEHRGNGWPAEHSGNGWVRAAGRNGGPDGNSGYQGNGRPGGYQGNGYQGTGYPGHGCPGYGQHAGHAVAVGGGRGPLVAQGARTASGRLAGGWIHEQEADPHFTGEAYLLGRASAEMHADLAAAFGTGPMPAQALAALADRMTRGLEQASAEVPELGRHEAKLRASYADILQTPGPVPVQRVHGDFHLGQVLRTQDGWVALDFEGEPAIPLAQRRARYPALKDVAGMLRSFDYAARHQLLGHPEEDRLRRVAQVWVERCQAAFCTGYAHAGGMDPLANAALMRALMLEKAVYEVLYEARHRPAWMSIPLESIAAA
jgi:predicted trehalose synthase